jgi:hypothetical protein
MSDARWFDVDRDVDAAVLHFRGAIDLYNMGGFDAAGLQGYQASMALMHALQSAYTSLEAALLRILAMLGEEKPVGDNWYADLIRRAAATLPGRRPAILDASLTAAADETRRFRHRAMHTYDSFEAGEVAPTVAAAKLLGDGLRQAVLTFRNAIDPS